MRSTSLIISLAFVLLAPPAAVGAGVDYAKEVKPLIATACVQCHGAAQAKGGLRLDTAAAALKGGENGAVIVAGKSDESLLVKLVQGPHGQLPQMPYQRSPLSVEQVALIKRWIDEGASAPADEVPSQWTHWAFVAPRRPAVPGNVPDQNRIDAFIRARLETEGIKPSPVASRETLIRRVSLDLTGLPPTLADVRAFVSNRDPKSYERLVDRLLASPHFGERWARHWLDLARYADSDGYLNDSVRPFAYVYRDWVIDAINRDLPFDRFTIEQLAGDLLPGATLDQKIATGFHRNTLKNAEAGVDREEDRCKIAVERVATTGAVWLGLTLGCAECHAHKYDPISQREFFSLYAFFNNTDDVDIATTKGDDLASVQKKKAAWEAKRDQLKTAIDDYIANKLPAAQLAWERGARPSTNRWATLVPRSAKSTGGATLVIGPDHTVASSGKNAPTDIYTIELTVGLPNATGLQLEALGEDKKGRTVGRGRKGGAILSEFTAAIRRAGGGKLEPVTFRTAVSAHSPAGSPITAAIDGDTSTGWNISPNVGQNHRAVFEFATPLELKDGDRLVLTLDQRGGYGEAFRRLRFAVTADAPPLGGDTVSEEITVVRETPAKSRTAEQGQMLSGYFQQLDPELRKLRADLQTHEANKPAVPKSKAQTLAVSKPRDTFVHVRGDFMRKGERVTPGVPDVLPAFRPRKSSGADRLDLANWLVDPANPLTSRVAVNHLWKNLFGRGLVNTVDDFGTRGEPPTHPELLDYLATEFIRLGWSRKQLIRLIVTSATYQQSSAARVDLVDRDPLNTLLARQSRSRLEAEAVRDVFLATSGLLNAKIGGPSIYPPLPGFVTAVGRDKSWPATKGDAQYRRGLYIHLRRNIPYPMLLTFDAPDSSVTCTRRERSNTPLQALTLLNDPVFFECSQALGHRLAAQPGDIAARLRQAFEHCVGRRARDGEMLALRSLHEDQLKLTGGDAKTAMVAVVRVIMNLDEFITRE